MINNIRSITAAAGYAHETLSLSPLFADLAADTGRTPETQAFLRTTRNKEAAAAGVLAGAYYDIVHAGGKSDPAVRFQAEVYASHALFVADIVDDVIDERAGTLDEKVAYMDTVRDLMCTGETDTDIEPHRSDPEKAAAIDLARSIGSLWRDPTQRNEFSRVLDLAIEGVKQQFSETNPQSLLLLAKQIGGGCMDLAQVQVDILEGYVKGERASIRRAGYLLGGYAEIFDHLYEIDHDLSAGLNTYPTARLREEGDYPEVRRSIREECLETANDCYQAGKALLTREQLVSYRALKMLIDVRYKLEVQLRRKKRLADRTPIVDQVVSTR